MCSTDIFLGLLAILFPPLPVWVKCGICSADSLINILLCMLGFLPGLFHSWYIIAKFPETRYEYQTATDSEGGRYYFVVHDRGTLQPAPASQMNYGATSGNNTSAPSAPPPQPALALNNSTNNNNDSGAGPSDGVPPPSYAQVVAGDHKIQSQE